MSWALILPPWVQLLRHLVKATSCFEKNICYRRLTPLQGPNALTYCPSLLFAPREVSLYLLQLCTMQLRTRPGDAFSDPLL